MKIINEDFKLFSSWISKVLKENVYLRFFIYGVILIFFILVLIRSYLSDSNNLAQWVSSISDFIMAIAATIGVIVASKWRRDTTKEKVINLIHDVISKKIPELYFSFSTHSTSTQFRSRFNNISVSISDEHDIERLKYIYKTFSFLLDRSHKDDMLIREIINNLNEIKILGWSLDESFIKVIYDVQKYLFNILYQLHSIESILSMNGYNYGGEHSIISLEHLRQYDADFKKAITELEGLEVNKNELICTLKSYININIFHLVK